VQNIRTIHYIRASFWQNAAEFYFKFNHILNFYSAIIAIIDAFQQIGDIKTLRAI